MKSRPSHQPQENKNRRHAIRASLFLGWIVSALCMVSSARAENWQTFQIGAPIERAWHGFELRLGTGAYSPVNNLGIVSNLNGNAVPPCTGLEFTLDVDLAGPYRLRDASTGDSAALPLSYGDFGFPGQTVTGWHLGDIWETFGRVCLPRLLG